jgi:hypothetical protein
VRDIQVRINKQRLDQAGAELCQAQTELIKVDLLGKKGHLQINKTFEVVFLLHNKANSVQLGWSWD